DILEELADKVITQIDSLAVARFEEALNEMTRYHRFLLDAYATTTPEGTPFSYAEIEDWFDKPFQKWMRQYVRLIERAATRISQETEFISTLAYVPTRLLPEGPGKYSSPVMLALLDFGPLLIHRLENWVTRHTISENVPGDR